MRGRLLPALAVGAALWVVAVSALAAGLSALGWWSPWVGWPVAVAVGVAAGWVVRGIPGVRMPSAAAVALVAVVVGFAVWAGSTHSEQVLPRRDAASNLQAAVSLATTHTRVVPVDADPVGGSAVLDHPGVTLASPAFFEVGSSTDPAGLSGVLTTSIRVRGPIAAARRSQSMRKSVTESGTRTTRALASSAAGP